MAVHDTWRRVRSLFDQAVELDGQARASFLDHVLAGEDAVRDAVEALLAADASAEGFMDQPIVARPSTMDDVRDAARLAEAGNDARDEAGNENRVKPHPSIDRLAGSHIGHYRVLRRIGQGGMSTVYLAVRDDDTFARRVVLKLVRADRSDADLDRRLRTERRILAGLDHANIARLFDGGTTEDGRPYFVMEYIEGLAIDAFADQHQLSIDERLTLFRKVCAAVHYAHQNLIVHRDLKPSNVLVTASGEPKLLDFGIAKVINPELADHEIHATASWLRMMTPQYASPEQARGRPVTTATDIYSLGVVLYQLLAGCLPFDFARCSAREIERIKTEHDPPKPSTASRRPGPDAGSRDEIARDRRVRPHDLRRRLSGDLDSIVMKALRSAPQRRYASAERLADDLERYQRGRPVEARQGSWRYRAGKLILRHRSAAVSALLLGAMLLATAAMLFAQHRQVVQERDEANFERRQRQTVLDLLVDILRVADPNVSQGETLTVREALERSGPKLRRQLRDQPALSAELLHTTGTIYYNLGLFTRARADLEQALALRQALYGDQHASVGATLSQLALVLGELGELESARAAAARAVASVRSLAHASRAGRRSAAMDRRLVPLLNNQVTILCWSHDYQTAEAPATQAVALARAEGVDPERLARALYNRGTVHLHRDQPRAAAPLFRQALDLLALRYGDHHPSLAPPLSNLGSALRRSGDLDGAETTFRRVLALQRQSLGDQHPSLASTLNNLAAVLALRHRGAEAIELYQRALAILRSAVGEDHFRVRFLELQIASVRVDLGEAATVETQLRPRLEAWRAQRADGDRSVAMGDRVLAQALDALHRDGEAQALLEAGLARALEAGEPATAKAYRQALDSRSAALSAPEDG